MGLFNNKLTNHAINVEGIKCEHCANRVKEALKKQKVKSNISIENKIVEVSFDENKITIEQIKQIINDLGYQCI